MDVEEEGTGQNRLFVILAVSLLGLLVLGFLGIGGVFVIRQNLQEQETTGRATPTLMAILPNPTRTFTPVPPLTTNTPAPTPTNTPVLSSRSAIEGEEAAAGESGSAKAATPTPKPSPTRTAVAVAAAAGSSSTVVPETGLGGLEIGLLALGLVIVLFIARRWRTSLE